ncbi:hypothetical protein ABFS83_07G054200 [Erythranthe nasuta]
MATPNLGNIHDNSAAADPHSSTSSGEPSGNDGDLVYGHVSVMGRQREMEDAVAVAPPGWMAGEYYFFAVYDGHGGAKVAEKCGETMHNCLAGHMEKAKKLPEKEVVEVERGFDWEKVMVDCFGNMDEELSGGDEVAPGAAEQPYWRMGSTAVVVLVGKAEVVVANCGDSRAVLCRGGAVVPLSTDHKPDRADEKQRIEATGGSVTNRNGWRLQGVLATSRSLGDHYLKPYVTSVPEVTVVSRSNSDEFLIIATDGLFDVVCNDAACELAKKCLASGRNSRQARAYVAATSLAELAIAKGSKDNISIIVVQLN